MRFQQGIYDCENMKTNPKDSHVYSKWNITPSIQPHRVGCIKCAMYKKQIRSFY